MNQIQTTHPGPDLYTIDLPWKRPPLNANQRHHWATKARITADTRNTARILARPIPHFIRVEAHLAWYVTDRRRRDSDNIYPTFKALCDGLVDAGIVADDTPQFMRKLAPEIRYDPGGIARMVLTVTPLKGTP